MRRVSGNKMVAWQQAMCQQSVANSHQSYCILVNGKLKKKKNIVELKIYLTVLLYLLFLIFWVLKLKKKKSLHRTLSWLIQYLYTDLILLGNSSSTSQKYPFKFCFLTLLFLKWSLKSCWYHCVPWVSLATHSYYLSLDVASSVCTELM